MRAWGALTGGTPENIDSTCDASKEKVIHRKPLLLAGFGKAPYRVHRVSVGWHHRLLRQRYDCVAERVLTTFSPPASPAGLFSRCAHLK
jgi:hypothetical protein